jgi:hypothetical protein
MGVVVGAWLGLILVAVVVSTIAAFAVGRPLLAERQAAERAMPLDDFETEPPLPEEPAPVLAEPVAPDAAVEIPSDAALAVNPQADAEPAPEAGLPAKPPADVPDAEPLDDPFADTLDQEPLFDDGATEQDRLAEELTGRLWPVMLLLVIIMAGGMLWLEGGRLGYLVKRIRGQAVDLKEFLRSGREYFVPL